MLSTDRCSHKKEENKYIHAPIMCEKKKSNDRNCVVEQLEDIIVHNVQCTHTRN
jgi:hypothetical protein